jgi:hypothetical protein
MKLSITQILLGTLIIILACFVAAWMISGVQELLNVQAYNTNHILVQDYTPHNEALFTISRCASVLLIALGLSVLITGASWWKVKHKKKLAKAQIIAGTLIVIIAAFIFTWGYTFDFIIAIEGGPVIDNASYRGFTAYIGILGLAVLVLGMIQLVKARRGMK